MKEEEAPQSMQASSKKKGKFEPFVKNLFLGK